MKDLQKKSEKALTWIADMNILSQSLNEATNNTICNAGVAQWLEHHLAKVGVEGSNLFARSISKYGRGQPRPFFFSAQRVTLRAAPASTIQNP